MKFLLWFFAGCACVGIPFFALHHSYDLWQSVIAGITGGILFFMILFVFVIKKYFSIKERIFFGMAHSIFIIAFVVYSVVFYKTTSFQRESLSAVRSQIGSEIIVGEEIYSRSVVLLRAYYNQPVRKKPKPLVEVFKSFYKDKINDGIFIPNTDLRNFKSPTWTFIQYFGDTLVKFISIDSVGKGVKTDFKGFTGLMGKIQYTAMITKGGVKYERNN